MQIPIFIINMASSIERWESTSHQLKLLGLESIRFDATIGKSLTEQEVAQWYDKEKNKQSHHRDLTIGEIGCYVSHKRVWKKIVDEQIPYCLILEDDLSISDELPKVLEQIEHLQGWELIKLFDNRDIPFVKSQKLNNTFSIGNFRKVPNGCLGYLLSLEGARKLLTRKRFYRAVDLDIQFHSEVGLSVIGIRPYPISEHNDFESDIESVNKGRHSNHSTFLRNLKFRIKMHFERKKISADLSKITHK